MDDDDLPETPPAHIWAFRALRRGILGTAAPTVNGISNLRITEPDEPSKKNEQLETLSAIAAEMDVAEACQGTPTPARSLFDHDSRNQPSLQERAAVRSGILKTPGTASYPKCVSWRPSAEPASETKRMRLPGYFPTPKTPKDTSAANYEPSPLHVISQHIDMLYENNIKLQNIINNGQVEFDELAVKQDFKQEKEFMVELLSGYEEQQLATEKSKQAMEATIASLETQLRKAKSNLSKVNTGYKNLCERNEELEEQLKESSRELDAQFHKADFQAKQISELNTICSKLKRQIEKLEHDLHENEQKRHTSHEKSLAAALRLVTLERDAFQQQLTRYSHEGNMQAPTQSSISTHTTADLTTAMVHQPEHHQITNNNVLSNVTNMRGHHDTSLGLNYPKEKHEIRQYAHHNAENIPPLDFHKLKPNSMQDELDAAQKGYNRSRVFSSNSLTDLHARRAAAVLRLEQRKRYRK